MIQQELLLQTTTETISKNDTSKVPPRSYRSTYKNLDNALNQIFPQQKEETNLSRTRRTLGEVGQQLSEDELKTIVTDFQFLIDTWLDAYEKEVFGGITLHNLLKGK